MQIKLLFEMVIDDLQSFTSNKFIKYLLNKNGKIDLDVPTYTHPSSRLTHCMQVVKRLGIYLSK